MNIGIILADVQITFRKAIEFGDQVRVGVRITRLETKSMTSNTAFRIPAIPANTPAGQAYWWLMTIPISAQW